MSDSISSHAGGSPLPGPRFEVVPHQPDGGFSAAGSGALIAVVMVVGVILGFIASWISQWFYLVLLFPIGIGLGLGFVAAMMVHLGKVRSPLVAGVAGFLGGCTAIFMMHYFDYRAFQSEIENIPPEVRRLAELHAQGQPLPPGLPKEDRELLADPEFKDALKVKSFTDYLDYAARQGVQIGRLTGGKDKGINLGYYGSMIFWIVELVIVAAISFAVSRAAATEPYCTACNSWKEARVLGSLQGEPEAAKAAIAEGDVGRLRDHEPSVEKGALLVTVHVCPTCSDQVPVELKLEKVTKNSKGNESRAELVIMTYPGEALQVIEAVFIPPEVEEVQPAEEPSPE